MSAAPIHRLSVLLVAGLALLLTGCLFTPGKFDSTMTVQRDGTFLFVYDGEISVFSLMQMAKMDAQGKSKTTCVAGVDGQEMDCTTEQVEDDEASAKERREREQFMKMLGGLDPSDPEVATKIAEELRKQRGWTRVERKDAATFDVRYETSGHLSHAFLFPLVENMPPVSPFVSAMPRADGSVRINAEGFGGARAGAMGPGMGFVAMMAGMAGTSEEDGPKPVLPDGTFTILTDGRILANNTDEGPETGAGGMQSLTWRVTESSRAAPTVLIALD